MIRWGPLIYWTKAIYLFIWTLQFVEWFAIIISHPCHNSGPARHLRDWERQAQDSSMPNDSKMKFPPEQTSPLLNIIRARCGRWFLTLKMTYLIKLKTFFKKFSAFSHQNSSWANIMNFSEISLEVNFVNIGLVESVERLSLLIASFRCFSVQLIDSSRFSHCICLSDYRPRPQQVSSKKKPLLSPSTILDSDKLSQCYQCAYSLRNTDQTYLLSPQKEFSVVVFLLVNIDVGYRQIIYMQHMFLRK